MVRFLAVNNIDHADDAGAQREHQGVSHYLGEVRRGEGVRAITASRAGDHQGHKAVGKG